MGLCPAILSEFNGMKYTYAHTITRQYMLASAAFLIENPDKAADTKATTLAAVESALKTPCHVPLSGWGMRGGDVRGAWQMDSGTANVRLQPAR